MKVLVSVLAMCLLASGCQTVSNVNVAIENTTESKQFQKICQLAPLAMSAFNLLRSQVQIKDDTVKTVNTAYSTIKVVCRNKPSNIVEALLTVTEAYTVILQSQSGVADSVTNELVK